MLTPLGLHSERSGSGRLAVQDFIARENIKRFRQQLANCTDEHQRATLKQLLNQEQGRLAQRESEGAEKPTGSL